MLPPRFLALALMPALAVVLAACGAKTAPDARTLTPLVRTAIVQPAGAASRLFTGTVGARVQSDLGFRVPGKVLERQVNTGQTVKRGQVLMRLDPADLKLASLAQQQAVAAARARAQQTADDELRYRDLRGTGAISESSYDQIKAAAEAARAQLSAAEAQSEVARNANRYSDLVADSEGTVLETLVEPGQVVAAGQPVVRIAQAGRREAVVQLPETLRPAIGSVGQATLFGDDRTAVPVKLRQLSDAADRVTRTFEARYVLEGELAQAPLGATVTVRLDDGKSAGRQGVQVPVGALFDAGHAPGVWVVAGEPAKVRWQPVTVESLSDDHAQVAGPLKQGDRVVALGAHLLREGEEVRIASDGAATAAAAAAVGGGALR